MIRIFTLTCISFAAFTASAQFEIGQKVLGGNVSFASGNEENVYMNDYENKYLNFTVNPSIATFTKSNKLQGIGLSYSNSYQKTGYLRYEISKNYSNSLGIELFSQRFISITKGLFFTLKTSAGASYQFGKQEKFFNSVPNDLKSTGFGIGAYLAPGISYKLTNRLLFDAYLSDFLALSYSHSKFKDPTSSTPLKRTRDSFRIHSSLSNVNLGNIGLGFRWLMKR